MKLSFQKENLLNSISIVMKAVSAKSTMSILECILVEAYDGVIKLTATDMELTVITKVEGNISEEGRVTVNARLFSEIVRSMPANGTVYFNEFNDAISISCEKANFNIPGTNGANFADIPDAEGDSHICINEFTLKQIIAQTIFSIGTSEIGSPVMTGEYMEVCDSRLRLISLDGHRISIRNVDLDDSYEENSVVIPGKSMLEISRILTGDAESDVYIHFSQNYIKFEFDDTVVYSRLIEGKYYQVDQMISNDFETKVVVNRKVLLDSIERAILLTREKDRKPIIINIKDGSMTLMMSSSVGSMDEEIEIEKLGADLMIAFNPRFLIDVLRVVDDEKINMFMVNAKTPCYIKDGENKYIYLILPVNFISPA